jgi:hypothetical protein
MTRTGSPMLILSRTVAEPIGHSSSIVVLLQDPDGQTSATGGRCLPIS